MLFLAIANVQQLLGDSHGNRAWRFIKMRTGSLKDVKDRYVQERVKDELMRYV